jgi:glycosyltransferase involved in cell wall biosynthesis
VPPGGYGGIENVVATLVGRLRADGVHVVLASVGESTLEADGYVTTFPDAQFPRLSERYADSVGIAHAHMQMVIEALDEYPIDVVHDHLEVVGPAMLASLGRDAPPALQTLHWDPSRHARFYADFDGRGRVFFAGVSRRQIELSPSRLREQTAGVVPLAVPLEAFPYTPAKDGPCVQLARICSLKGQHVAAQTGEPTVLAGHVEDERYWAEQVAPHVDGSVVRWVGSVAGPERLELLRSARAALFPVQWEEPGGTAVVEALACGTPVVAMRRGCMPELIAHGVTGWLADTAEEFTAYVRRAHEIDPAACRLAAETRFSAKVMAERYVELYERLMLRAPRTRPAAHAAVVQPATG